MDLRQLEYVVAVADQRTFTRAARSVHVSQPSLSHGIRSLEHELGVELFARLGRTVAPTSAGLQVIDAARRVLRELADLGAVAAAAGALETGTLDLVALPTLAVDPVAALIGRFRTEHPGIVIHVHEPEEASGVEHSVRSGRAELGLTDLGGGGHGLTQVTLFRQTIVAVSPPGSADAEGALSARELAALPLIVTPVGTSTRRLLDRTLARDRLEPNIAVEINYREAIIPLVLAGAGTSLLPERMADDAAARGAVVRALRPALSRRIGLLHRPTRLSPAADAMLRLARSALTSPA
jgi:DNA-binding transcriptional LysR family regulator